MTDQSRAVVLEASLDATGVRAGTAEIQREVGAMANAVARSGQDATAAVAGIGSGASRSASQIEAAQRNLIGSIERTTAAMQAGSRTGAAYYETLARQRGVDPAVLAPYLAQLRAVEAQQVRSNAALAGASPALHQVGVSAAQTAAALRGVPAQFTDIITSIQGGQAPLTVLLQQGGQLKDMFGGVGAAAKALGGYVLGLVNPYTVAAVAVGALAIAHHAGAAEAKAYRETLILSGNAAGATSNQLADISRTIGLVSGSQRVAAEAVTALAGTGRVSVDNLQKFGAAAVEVQKVIGRSIADTATDFESLGKTPLTALDQINQKYHFITAATFAQVKALQDQGRATEAAKLAQDAYADAVVGQKDKILASLTDWERGWIRIKNAASGAVDAAIDAALGRQVTGVQKITAALAERELIEKRIAVAVSKGDTAKEATFRADLAQNAATINGLRAKEDSTKAVAAAEAATARATEAKNKWLKDGDQYLSRAAQLERDITVARNEGKAAQLSSGEIEKRVGDIRKKYADIFNDGIDSNIEALKRRAAVEDVLSKRALAQIQANRALGSITEAEAIKQTSEVELADLDKKRVLVEQELRLAKGKQNSLKEQAELSGQLRVIDETRLNRSIQQTTDLLLLDEKRAQASRDLFGKGVSTAGSELESLKEAVKAQGEYNEAIGLNKVQVAALQATRIDALATLKDESAAALDAIEPGSQLAAIYRDQAEALRERATGLKEGAGKEFQFDEWKKAVETYSDVFRTGFADMLNHGKDGWKSFTKSLVTTFKTSVADQIYKMFAQPFVVKMVASLLGVTGAGAATAAQVAGASGLVGQAPSLLATAGNAYSLISGGLTLAGGLGTGFAGSVAGGLMGAGVGSGLTSATGLAIGESIAGVVGPAAAGSIASGMATVAAAMPWLAAAAVGGFLLTKAFGHGERKTESTTLNGSLSSMGFAGSIDQKWREEGGWFSSDRTGTTPTAVDSQTAKALSSAYDQIKAASTDFAKVLGINADSIKDRAQSLSIALTDDKAANEKAITDFFVGVGDSIAKELLPTISNYARASKEFSGATETASATLERLATEFRSTDQFASLFGKSAAQIFGGAGIESIGARERLLDATGGATGLSQSSTAYMRDFYSESEKLAPVISAVSEALKSLGLSSVQTKEDFKAQVDGLINSGALATKSGADLFASLMALAPAFSQVSDAAKAEVSKILDLQAQMYAASGDQVGALSVVERQRAAALLLLGPAEAAATKAAWEAIDAAKARAESLETANGLLDIQAKIFDLTGNKAAAASVLEKQHAFALQAMAPALREATQELWALEAKATHMQPLTDIGNVLAATMTKAKEAAKELREYNQELLIGNLSTLSDKEKYALARNGLNSADAEHLKAAEQAFLQASKALNGDGIAYARDFAGVLARNESEAAGKDLIQKTIPDMWRSIRDLSLTGSGAAASVVPAQIYSAQQPAPAVNQDTVSRAEFEQTKAQLAAALAKIASSTAATAETLDDIATGRKAITVEG